SFTLDALALKLSDFCNVEVQYFKFHTRINPQAISKVQITFKDKARVDEKVEHTWEYVSILKRLATP
ncbi:MAG: hypothetical protein KJ687_02320, partial [Proteobacteria bacterium]|nr:hypothetical protein [Pseudomonadota bacterium]